MGRNVQHENHTLPQGIQHDEPTDYFQRLMAEQLAPGELRDQTVLSDIESWLQSRSQQLVDRLSGAEDGGDRYARVCEHFAWRIGDHADLGDVDERLNAMGRERWECYHVSEHEQGRVFYFKRRTSNAVAYLTNLLRVGAVAF